MTVETDKVVCSKCGDTTVAVAAYNAEHGYCVFCYADSLGHGGEVDSIEQAELFIRELFPKISHRNFFAAMILLTAYPHTSNLPLKAVR